MKNLEQHLKSNSFSSLYLIYGEEYLKKQYEKKFIDKIILKQFKMMNLSVFEGNKIKPKDIIDTADTLPFMSETRLVIVKNSSLFFEGRKADTEELVKYLPKIPKTTKIIFFEEKVDKRLKIVKELSKIGYVTELKNLGENELISWILNIFSSYNINIENATIIYLIRYVGYDMEILFNEVHKLIDYKLNGNISKEDINNICTKSLEANIFDLINCIGNKNLKSALNIYNNLLINKVYPTVILAMIVRQFRLILQVKYMNKNGYNNIEISKELEIREFVVRECLKHSKNFTNKVILNALEDCKNYDFKIKTGKIQDTLGLELLISKYSK